MKRIWLSSLIIGLFFMYESINLNMFNSLAPYFIQQFNVQNIGTLSFIHYVSNAACVLPAGILLDRFIVKYIAATALLLSISAIFLLANAQTYLIASLALALSGVAAAFSFNAGLKYATLHLAPKQIALYTGIIVALGNIGGVIAQAPLAFYAKIVSWRAPLMTNAIFGLLILIFIISLTYANKQVVRQHESFYKKLTRVMSLPHNWLVNVYISTMNISITVVGAVWGSNILMHRFHMTYIKTTNITLMIFCGMIIGAPIIGRVANLHKNPVKIMQIGAILALAVYSILFLLPNQWASLAILQIIFFILGLIASCQILGYPLINQYNYESVVGTALGLAAIFIIGGGGIMQLLFGVFLAHFGYNSAYLIIMSCITAAGIAAYQLRKYT